MLKPPSPQGLCHQPAPHPAGPAEHPPFTRGQRPPRGSPEAPDACAASRDEPIPEDVFAAILEAGRLAPSTVNLQTWSFASVLVRGVGRNVRPAAARSRPLPRVIILADTHRARSCPRRLPAQPARRVHDRRDERVAGGDGDERRGRGAGRWIRHALGDGPDRLSRCGLPGRRLYLPPGVIPIMTDRVRLSRPRARPMPPKLPLRDGHLHRRVPGGRSPGVMEDWLNQMMAGYPRATWVVVPEPARGLRARSGTPRRTCSAWSWAGLTSARSAW